MAQRLKHLPTMQGTWVRSLGQEDTLEKEMARKFSTPVFLPGEFHGWRSLVGYSPPGRKESDTTEQLHFHYPQGLLHQFHYTPYSGLLPTLGGPLGWPQLQPEIVPVSALPSTPTLG